MLYLLVATVVKDNRRIPEKGSGLQCLRMMCMAYLIRMIDMYLCMRVTTSLSILCNINTSSFTSNPKSTHVKPFN